MGIGGGKKIDEMRCLPKREVYTSSQTASVYDQMAEGNRAQ